MTFKTKYGTQIVELSKKIKEVDINYDSLLTNNDFIKGVVEEVLSQTSPLDTSLSVSLGILEKLTDISDKLETLGAAYKDVIEELGLDEVVDSNPSDRSHITPPRPHPTRIVTLISDITSTTPKRIYFEQDEIGVPVSSWKDVYENICEILYEKDNKIFESFVNKRGYMVSNEKSLQSGIRTWGTDAIYKINGSSVVVYNRLGSENFSDNIKKMFREYNIGIRQLRIEILG